MSESRTNYHDEDAGVHSLPGEVEPVRAWQRIDTGRYQPRRIRGSFPGRELG